MENFPILVHNFSMENFQAETKNLYIYIYIYMYGILKSMEEKPYFRKGYLRLFFTVHIHAEKRSVKFTKSSVLIWTA